MAWRNRRHRYGVHASPRANLTRTLGASQYAAVHLGDPGDPNGAIIVGPRADEAEAPFPLLGAYDDGSSRRIVMGGGTWGTPDATDIWMYTAPDNETLDQGIPHFHMEPNGACSFGQAVATANAIIESRCLDTLPNHAAIRGRAFLGQATPVLQVAHNDGNDWLEAYTPGANETDGRLRLIDWENTITMLWGYDSGVAQLGCTTAHTLQILGQGVKMPAFTTGSLPAAATVGAGTQLWDSSQDLPVWSDGSDWINVVVTTGINGAAVLPVGTTGERPLSPDLAYLRGNSDLEALETYVNSQWRTVANVDNQGSGYLVVSNGANGRLSGRSDVYVSGTSILNLNVTNDDVGANQSHLRAAVGTDEIIVWTPGSSGNFAGVQTTKPQLSLTALGGTGAGIVVDGINGVIDFSLPIRIPHVGTPADPPSGESVIWVDTNGDLQRKTNVASVVRSGPIQAYADMT